MPPAKVSVPGKFEFQTPVCDHAVPQGDQADEGGWTSDTPLASPRTCTAWSVRLHGNEVPSPNPKWALGGGTGGLQAVGGEAGAVHSPRSQRSACLCLPGPKPGNTPRCLAALFTQRPRASRRPAGSPLLCVPCHLRPLPPRRGLMASLCRQTSITSVCSGVLRACILRALLLNNGREHAVFKSLPRESHLPCQAGCRNALLWLSDRLLPRHRPRRRL